MTEELVDWKCDVKGYIKLNSYWGGKKNGRCIQLTTPLPTGYSQMTYDNARDFFQTCINQINEIEKRYNLDSPWWEELTATKLEEDT